MNEYQYKGQAISVYQYKKLNLKEIWHLLIATNY